VQNFEIGIRLSGATSSTVQNNVSQLNRRYGIEMTQSSTAILLQGNTVAGNSDEGIHISGPTTKDAVHHIVGNTLSGNSLEGIYFLNSSANTVTGNTVENHGAAGIYLKNSHRNAVQENTLINNPFQLVSGSQGNILTNNTIIGDRIKFDEASDNLVRAHSVQELGGRPSTAYDLNKASRNTIEDSVAIDPVDYHIRVANSSQDNVFTRFSTTPQTLQCYVDATSSVTVTNPSGQILQCSNSE